MDKHYVRGNLHSVKTCCEFSACCFGLWWSSWSSHEINRKCPGSGTRAFLVFFNVALMTSSVRPINSFSDKQQKSSREQCDSHMFTLSSKKKSCMCVRWGDGNPGAKATESGLNTLRPLSLKVCQRVHGGRRPSKNTIMGFNAFHLRRENGLWLHVLHGVGSTMYQFMAIRGVIKLLPGWGLEQKAQTGNK